MADKLTLDRNDMKNPATSHLRIYVGGLVDKATVAELYDHFIPYGQINGIIINRNFGFVQFESESSVQTAISKANGSTFLGKPLYVKTAQNNADKQRHQPEQPEAPPSAVVHNEKSQEPVSNNQQDESDDLYDNYGNYIGDQANYMEEEYEETSFNQNRNENIGRGGGRTRSGGRTRTRGPRNKGGPFSDRSPMGRRGGGDWQERGGYDRYQQQIMDYQRPIPVTEKNDCEIIVVSKSLTEYAEYIEGRLKRLGIVVDLLFPMEDVPIGKVLGNIASRGCLYAILVMPQNQEHRSLTLTILHGLPQEHRNMPIEDALQLLSRNFQEVQRGGSSGREAVYALLGQLADGRTLTVLQYDKVIEYMQERREQQVKIELGEPLNTPQTKTQVDLQQRILSILNDKKLTPKPEVPVEKPQETQNKLLNDANVRKALDSILKKFT